MDHAELREHLQGAINELYARDDTLLRQDGSEWSIASQLARYIERRIPGWNVDCEYNRQGTGMEKKQTPDGKGVRPDIVVHHRGRFELSHNLLVVELKKEHDTTDLEKACSYTRAPDGARPFQYQFGLALTLGDEPTLSWFREGEGC